MLYKRFVAVLALAVVVGGLVMLAVSRAGSEQPAAPSDEVRDLRKRVEKLEARVAELEQRVPRVIVPAQGPPELRVAPEAGVEIRPVPKGWVPREFNGQRCYDIPLQTPEQRK
jgi:hypothetical protein